MSKVIIFMTFVLKQLITIILANENLIEMQLPLPNLPCKKQTCRFGVCENVILNGQIDFTCHCIKGVVGKKCDHLDREKLPCSSNPCYAQAKCYNYQNSYFCECPLGRTGKDCSVAQRSVLTDPCLTNPCGKNGICFSASNGYWCFCDDGSQGLSCSKADEKVNMCTPNSCLNNGKCYTVNHSILCACPPNFYGPKCESLRVNSIFTPECNSQLCYNNGVCTLSNHTITCACNALHTGKFCENPLYNPCGFGLCHSVNGKCQNGQCVCNHGFYGDKCHLKI